VPCPSLDGEDGTDATLTIKLVMTSHHIHGHLVGATLVHRDFVGIAVRCHGLVEEALGCGQALGRHQEVDSLARLVDSAIKVFSDALDLDVRLIYAPTADNRALVVAGDLL